MTRIAVALLFLLAVSVCHAAPKIGDKAPGFRAVTSSGTAISLSDYVGKTVILEFFATWCVSCRQLPPFLVDMENKYKVKIIGMDIDDSGKEKIDAYVRKHGISFPVVFAEDKVQILYGIRSVPVLYIIGKDGTISGKFNGFNKDIAASIESLLQKAQ